jgi:polar amino acid transport system substrate-binding protein
MDAGWWRRSAAVNGAAAWLIAATLVAAADPDVEAAPKPLRVGVTPIASIVDWTGDGPTGAMLSIWEELARRIGAETNYVRFGTILDLMAATNDGSIDVALGPLAITEERERTLDLTHPVFHSGMRIAVRQKNDGGLLQAARSMLSWQLLELLAGVLILAVASGHLLWWFERGHNPRSFPPEYPRGVIEAMWWIASTIITGGCDDKHVDGPIGRILAFAWMVGGIGLIAAFTSVLTATMTAERVSGLIHGPRDLSGRLVGVQRAAVTTGCVRQRGGMPQEYATLRDAIQALDLGMVEAVVGETETLSYIVNEAGKGRIKIVGPLFDEFDFGIALPNGSPIRESLNTVILRMREEGAIERIKDRWIGKHD